MAQTIGDNIQQTNKSLKQDSILVQDVLNIVEEAKVGRFGKLVVHKSLNPQINELKDAINAMSSTLLELLGDDLKKAHAYLPLMKIMILQIESRMQRALV